MFRLRDLVIFSAASESMVTRPTGVVRVGVFEVDFDARQLRRLGRVVPLQEKPFELLSALLGQPGVVVSRGELRSRLWPADTYVAFDDNLNTAAAKLRSVFGDSARSPRYIETVPRLGYRWIGPFESAPFQASPTPREPSAAPSVSVLPIAGTRTPYPRQVWMLFLALLVVTLAATVLSKREARSSSGVPNRFEFKAPAGTTFPNGGVTPNASVSPDGRWLFFIARRLDETAERIWLRSLNGATARPLEGTEAAWGPFWAPDSQRIGFFANRKLKTIDLRSRIVRVVAEAPAAGSGAWNPRDEILYGPAPDGALMRISAAGGTPAQATLVDTAIGEQRHAWPQFFGDGDQFLYLAQFKAPAESQIVATSLRDPTKHTILRSSTLAAYSKSGHLLFVRDRTLLAQPFDLDRLSLEGSPVVLADDVNVNSVTGRALFAASDSGVLVFSGSRQPAVFELTWFDRHGRPLAKLAPPMASRRFALSPDGSKVAVEAEGVRANLDLWLIDTAGGSPFRLTAEPIDEEHPVWTPDGGSLIFARHRASQAPSDLWSTSVDGQSRSMILTRDRSVHPYAVSSNSRVLLFEQLHADRTTFISALSFAGRTVTEVVPPGSDAREARLSADGRWIAYSAVEQGRREVYVRRLEGQRTPIRVSHAGGSQPTWNPAGDELFFISADRQIALTRIADDGNLRASVPQVVMDLNRLVSRVSDEVQYDISRDGRRLLLARLIKEHEGATVTLLSDWSSALPR